MITRRGIMFRSYHELSQEHCSIESQGELFCSPSESSMRNFLSSEAELIAAAAALGARRVQPVSKSEAALLDSAGRFPKNLQILLAEKINLGQDPLGAAFCRLRTPELRRRSGATFTPRAIVGSMARWAK